MSPQGTTGVATSVRGTAARKKSTMSQKLDMSPGGEQECANFTAIVLERQRNAEDMTGMQSFSGGFHGENRGWREAQVSLQLG